MVKVEYRNGLIVGVEDRNIVFDPVGKVSGGNLMMISHAHSDHINGVRNGDGLTLVLSPATMDIIVSKTRKFYRNIDVIEPNGFKKYDSVLVEAYNAGHVLGSLQFLLELYNLRVGYTGDFNIYGSLVDEPATVMKDLDILIIESTYGRPDYVFPHRSFIYERILSWVAENIKEGYSVVIGVYPLGKAQELTYLFNREFGGVIVTESVYRINEIFDKHKFKLNYKSIEDNMRSVIDGGEIVISSTSEVSRIINMVRLGMRGKVVGAVCTGWSLNYYNSNGLTYFPLSSHSDFKGLLKYVEEANPRMVYTVYGFASEFASYIERKLNIKAKPLG
jgi:putative mRNA 3-end processing factor